jgi:ABC-2 type transport system permease protein
MHTTHSADGSHRPRPTLLRLDSVFATLTARRFALSVRTPRDIAVPLLTPLLFALVIAPALASIAPDVGGIDYMSFVAVGTAGLLVPLNCMFAGIGAVMDRHGGAHRDLLAAPIRRSLMVVANLVAAVTITAVQVAVLIAAAFARGAKLDTSLVGWLWFIGSTILLAVAMYGIAETLANKVATVAQFTGALPPIAIVPFFFAGSLFPIGAMPTVLTMFARVLPLTHALALMRYGLVDRDATGLHDIWGMSSPTTMAALSLAVVTGFAAISVTTATRTFQAKAVS